MNIVKESLAKLLAQEDLIVETRNVESAQFNVETRVLTLPNWKHTSTEVVDSLIALLENQNSNTNLYQNYPNPFNPETWIPFEIAEDCLVLVQIHDTNGNLIRELDLGFCAKGVYTNKSKAAYWDGCNQQGEKVSSGMYFYMLNNVGLPRKMIVLK